MMKLKENKVMTIDLDAQTVMHFTFWVRTTTRKRMWVG